MDRALRYAAHLCHADGAGRDAIADASGDPGAWFVEFRNEVYSPAPAGSGGRYAALRNFVPLGVHPASTCSRWTSRFRCAQNEESPGVRGFSLLAESTI